jgi:hypothetical protein
MNQDIVQLQQQQLPNFRYFKKKISYVPTSYIPTEDGFITSSGNPTLAAKYGNNIGANTFTIQDVINSTKK